MLSALLRAGHSLTVGLSCLSTADSILMSYQKLESVFFVRLLREPLGRVEHGHEAGALPAGVGEVSPGVPWCRRKPAISWVRQGNRDGALVTGLGDSCS